MAETADTGWSHRRGAFTFTVARIAQVAGIAVIALIGALLPYLTLGYEDYASEPVRPTESLFPAAQMIRVLNLGYVPATAGVNPDDVLRGIDLMAFGSTAHQVGLIVAILTGWGLFMDEINKFLWWPLHLSGWILLAGTAAMGGGVSWLQSLGVDAHLGIGWVPLTLAGIAILVITFRARSRIDTYRGA